MQSLLSSHRPQAARKPCLNSQNYVHGRKLVSVEVGIAQSEVIFGGLGQFVLDRMLAAEWLEDTVRG